MDKVLINIFDKIKKDIDETNNQLQILIKTLTETDVISTDVISNVKKLKETIKILIELINKDGKVLNFFKEQKIEYLIIKEVNELKSLYENESLEMYTRRQIIDILDGMSNNINLNTLIKSLVYDILNYDKKYSSVIDNEFDRYIEKLIHIFEGVLKLFGMETILSSIITEGQSTIIVGENGAGKSELLQKLRETKLQNCFVIPANKNLFIEHHLTYIEQDAIIREIQGQNFKKSMYDDGRGLFSSLVNFYISEHSQRKTDGKKREQSQLDKVEEIWNKIFPEIEFFTHSGKRTLEFSKNKSEKYSFNQLSDGERSVLFYLLIVVLIPEKSLIIIDEPETHLNIALCNKLWDYLLEEKEESKFVFISHNKDFIESRVNSDVIWCKNYDINNDKNNKFIKIEKNDILPRDLIVSLLGSKKEKILFCEGKDSERKAKEHDYAIYNLLYSDEYFVKPVEGHLSVIEYTKAYNELKEKLEMNSKEAYGIIDRDCLNNEEVQKLRSKNIIVLPANEIEMLMLHEKILEYYLQPHHENKEIKHKIEKFKEAFKNKLLERKDKVILNYVRSKCNKIFENRRIENFKTISELENSKNKIFNEIDLEKFQNELEIELEKIISEINYEEMLRVCSLKNEIIRTPEVGGIIDREYEEYPMKCLNVIKRNKELQNIIREYIGVPFDNNLNNN